MKSIKSRNFFDDGFPKIWETFLLAGYIWARIAICNGTFAKGLLRFRGSQEIYSWRLNHGNSCLLFLETSCQTSFAVQRKIFSVHTDILFQNPELTKGFYKKAYNGLFQEYYTDRYYLAVGNVEKEQGKRGLNLVTAIIIRSRPETRDGSKGEHNGSNFWRHLLQLLWDGRG